MLKKLHEGMERTRHLDHVVIHKKKIKIGSYREKSPASWNECQGTRKHITDREVCENDGHSHASKDRHKYQPLQ